MFSDFPLYSCVVFQPSGLAIHIFNDDIVDFAERRAVFQHLPRLVGMIVNFNHIFVADGNQTVALKVIHKVIVNLVLIKIVSVDEQLRVIAIFQHGFAPFRLPLPFRKS